MPKYTLRFENYKARQGTKISSEQEMHIIFIQGRYRTSSLTCTPFPISLHDQVPPRHCRLIPLSYPVSYICLYS
ncbi:hypothetical protein LZ554_006594 [Drepanopeziza brunnea f. sp. 'monogermtubi']|nr:hypothetical protein LZ554_006594 [Drepanopeziza brunnea f. sp. 'monogermtubi']